MSTESVKVCLVPSAFTDCKRPLIRQSAAAYTATLHLHSLALHQNSKASLLVKTSRPLNIRTKKAKTLSPGYFPLTSPPPFKSGPWSLKKIDIPPWAWPQIPPLLEWAPKGQSIWSKQQCLLLPFFWILHLPSHLPWKHHALSNKTRHLLCRCQHRENSHIHASPFLK